MYVENVRFLHRATSILLPCLPATHWSLGKLASVICLRPPRTGPYSPKGVGEKMLQITDLLVFLFHFLEDLGEQEAFQRHPRPCGSDPGGVSARMDACGPDSDQLS
jgi:hypothetical protein